MYNYPPELTYTAPIGAVKLSTAPTGAVLQLHRSGMQLFTGAELYSSKSELFGSSNSEGDVLKGIFNIIRVGY